MNKFKKFILLSVILFLASCSTVKEGFKNQKKNSSDEFLVEKKAPLVMPPDYNELLEPKTAQGQVDPQETKIKNLINKEEEKSNDSNNVDEINQSFEESLLDKIKNN